MYPPRQKPFSKEKLVKYQLILLSLAFIGAATLISTYFGRTMNIESRHDLLFESNTLFILFFIYFVLAKRVVTSYLVRNGFLLLIINQACDVVTEIEFLTSWWR